MDDRLQNFAGQPTTGIPAPPRPPMPNGQGVTPPTPPRPPVPNGQMPSNKGGMAPPPLPNGSGMAPPPLPNGTPVPPRPPMPNGGTQQIQGGIPRPPMPNGGQPPMQPPRPNGVPTPPPMPGGMAPPPRPPMPNGASVPPMSDGTPQMANGGQQMQQATTPVPPRPATAPPPPRPNQPTQGSGPVVMAQSDFYDPSGRGPSDTPPPVNNNNNSNNNQTNQNKSSGNKTMVLLAVVVFLVVAVGCFVLFVKPTEKPEEQTPTGPIEGAELVIETEVIPVFEYSENDILMLRSAGYTGDEIEEFEKLEVDAMTKVQEAMDAQQKFQQEQIDKVFDGVSDEYWAIQNNTWLGLEERWDYALEGDNWTNFSDTFNIDYEKIPVRGTQCFIKVYLDDNVHETYCFMLVEPQRYAELSDTGNIIVTITFKAQATWNENGTYDYDLSSAYITDIRESNPY